MYLLILPSAMHYRFSFPSLLLYGLTLTARHPTGGNQTDKVVLFGREVCEFQPPTPPVNFPPWQPPTVRIPFVKNYVRLYFIKKEVKDKMLERDRYFLQKGTQARNHYSRCDSIDTVLGE